MVSTDNSIDYYNYELKDSVKILRADDRKLINIFPDYGYFDKDSKKQLTDEDRTIRSEYYYKYPHKLSPKVPTPISVFFNVMSELGHYPFKSKDIEFYLKPMIYSYLD